MRRLPLRSPPRMRGKELYQPGTRDSFRITPAYAGKRCAVLAQNDSHWDHPRVCGEKMDGVKKGNLALGSPPRMRGKARRRYFYERCRGITPAYAGKSTFYKKGTCHIEGSPPRMRGKAFSGMFGRSWTGITPAYAGKRMICWHRQNVSWDHPRVCGEKAFSD